MQPGLSCITGPFLTVRRTPLVGDTGVNPEHSTPPLGATALELNELVLRVFEGPADTPRVIFFLCDV